MGMMGWGGWGRGTDSLETRVYVFVPHPCGNMDQCIQQDCTVVKVQPQPGFTPASDMFAR